MTEKQTAAERRGAEVFAQKFEEWRNATPNWAELLAQCGYRSGTISDMQAGSCTDTTLIFGATKAGKIAGMFDIQDFIFSRAISKMELLGECEYSRQLPFREIKKQLRDLEPLFGSKTKLLRIGFGVKNPGGTDVRRLFAEDDYSIFKEQAIFDIMRLLQQAHDGQLPTKAPPPAPTKAKPVKSAVQQPPNVEAKRAEAPILAIGDPNRDRPVIDNIISTVGNALKLAKRCSLVPDSFLPGDQSILVDYFNQFRALVGEPGKQGGPLSKQDLENFVKGKR